MLEPAAYGAAVCFGPNTKNFREISERMVRDGAAVVVRNAEELNTFLGRCLTEPEWGRSLGEAATRLVLSQQGACRITTELLAEL
jgi:3-deoxy-D-manno-octulosonic-acid transferase